jgi:hypothetical protein
MATFCPKCGLDNQPDRNFCRGCGTNLRLVKQALEPGPTADVPNGMTQTTQYAIDTVLRKISELQLDDASDLEEVVEQVGKLTESDELRKVRYARNGIVTVAIIAGALCFFGLAFLSGRDAPTVMLFALVSIFLAIVVPLLLYMLYQLTRPLRRSETPPRELPAAPIQQPPATPPQVSHRAPRSVTEHTTQQLADATYRPSQGDITQSR